MSKEQTAAPIPVDFTPKSPALHLRNLGAGVYAKPHVCKTCKAISEPTAAKCPSCSAALPKPKFYERPMLNGRQTTRRLRCATLRIAQQELGKRRSEHEMSKLGRALDPYAQAQVSTVAGVLAFYKAAGCPMRDGQPRSGKQLSEEHRSLSSLERHLGRIAWNRLTLEDLPTFHRKRLAEMKEGGRNLGPGNRTVDIEERVLSSAFRWALRNSRRTGVDRNPVAHDRQLHDRPENVRHCRDVMPANAEELHQLAAALFEWPASEVLGWQLLFEAMVGQRTSEILRLRMDAAGSEPGHVQGGHLWLYHSKTAKGTFPYAEIHPALKECLEAHKAWHGRRFPKSPWYFPSHHDKGARAVRPDALTHALRRVTADLGLKHVTSHGLRSYFVNVLRSEGKLDSEIALRIGQKTGGSLIVRVYGEILPYKLGWKVKEREKAWKSLQARPG